MYTLLMSFELSFFVLISFSTSFPQMAKPRGFAGQRTNYIQETQIKKKRNGQLRNLPSQKVNATPFVRTGKNC